MLTPLLALVVAVSDSATFIRVNQVGYLPDAPKVAIACSLGNATPGTFVVKDERGRTVFGPRRAESGGAFGPCVTVHRLDFTALHKTGRYRIVAGTDSSSVIRIGPRVYDGAADTLLYYMRQQRSGWNPLFKDSVHTRDAIIVDSPRAGEVVSVSGGWADASDYLQYVTTSAYATYVMMMAYRDHSWAFADHFDANGVAGSNGIADVLDEARHGLEWLSRMFPDSSLMFNQIADDRDHAFFDLPNNDSSDYGWGRGKERPVYPCTGKPQGLFQHKNRSTGYASTAGKYASAFAIGARMFADRDSAFASVLRRKARMAYEIGRANPGVCQTAPGRAPYFYEEDNWTDDMELGAAELHALTGDRAMLAEAIAYAQQEPKTPWMGADTANHYQWFPWHNNGHYEIWRNATTRADTMTRVQMAEFYRRGLEAVAGRAENGFRIGVPFIWCSNNLMASFATQALLYRRMTGDNRYRGYEQAAIDWLFGTNPWGTSMVIGYPHDAVTATDPHSAVSARLGVDKLLGGLLDGPVYRSIYQNLRGITLHHSDRYERFNTGRMVYHDDLGDYSTNEPIMDGTANMTYLMSALAYRRSTSPRMGSR
ncbi:MAG: glycoside hydrolase family 9 protein [bacterium]